MFSRLHQKALHRTLAWIDSPISSLHPTLLPLDPSENCKPPW